LRVTIPNNAPIVVGAKTIKSDYIPKRHIKSGN